MVAPLHLRATRDGVIWPRRPHASANGLLCCARNLPLSASNKRATCFRAVAFNVAGDVLAAVDDKGRVFVFFVTSNRYALVQHLGAPALACCFSPRRKTELLVTSENEMARCIDVQSQALISTLRGHRLPAHCACFQTSGKLALTASQDAVILWDCMEWTRYRVLNAGPGVEQASFVSPGDLVAVCFQDDSIMMWELESLALRYRFLLPEHEQPAGLSRIAVSDDQKTLVATGRSRLVYVWDFTSQTITRIIELPSPIEHVINHSFVPGHDSTVGILGNDGSLFFLKVTSSRPKIRLEVNAVSKESKIIAFDTEPHGRYLAATTDDGCLLLFDMDIAKETARRRRSQRKRQGLLELEENLHLPTRPGVVNDQPPTSVWETQQSRSGRGHEQRASSRLLDSVFGQQHGRNLQHQTLRQPAEAEIVPTSQPVIPSKRDEQTIRATPEKSLRRTHPQRSVLARKDIDPTVREVNRKRLESSLRCHGSYPAKFRVLVWKFLLQLPKNDQAFSALLSKGSHPAFVQLHDRYPLQSARLFRRLHRVLSAIAHWCPAFGEVEYLPAVVYPFIKVFREDDLSAFEASLCVLLHWCPVFLANLPNPPYAVMAAIEGELRKLDPQLSEHFVQHNVGPDVYVWSLLKTLFAEVLTDVEWLALWDHLVTHTDKPWMLFAAALAYVSHFRVSLLAAYDRFSIEQFFHQQNALQMDAFIQLMNNLCQKHSIATALGGVSSLPSGDEETNQANSEQSSCPIYWPLPRGQYPAFAHYPRLIVAARISERNRIALEETELAQKKQVVLRLEQECEALKAQHAKWLHERKMLLAAEDKRRQEAITAERYRIVSLKTLDYETRKRRLERLARMEAAAKESLEETARLFQAEYARLDAEVAMMKERADFEISSRQQEEEMQQIEFESEQRVKQILRQRDLEERLQQLRQDFAARIKQGELQDLLKFDSWKQEDAELRRQAQQDVEREVQAAHGLHEAVLREQLETRLHDHANNKENEMDKLEAQRKARIEAEERELQRLRSNIEKEERTLADLRARLDSQRSYELHPDGIATRSERVGPISTEAAEVRGAEGAPTWQRGSPSPVHDSPLHEDDEEPRQSARHEHAIPLTAFAPMKDENEDRPDNQQRRSQQDFADRVRRELSAVLASDENSSADDDSIDPHSISLERTQQEMALLQRALDVVSSASSSPHSSRHSRIEQDKDTTWPMQSAQPTNEGRPEYASSLDIRTPLNIPQPIVPPGMFSEASSAMEKPSMLEDPPQALQANQVVGDSTAVHANPSTSSNSSSLDDAESSYLQRPIEELEAALGIHFDEASEEKSDLGDDELGNDRVELLRRAKMLLHEHDMLSDPVPT